MERINKTLSKNYLTARLFLDDLEEIQSVLASSRNFEIKTDDYSFSTIEELKEKYGNGKLTNLEISSYNPYINIELRKLWVRLYCGSDEVLSAGTFAKLDSIISRTSLKPNALYSYYTFWVGNLLLYVAPNLTGKYYNKLTFVILGVFLGIYVLWVSYIRMFRSGEVILTKRGDSKSFFSRNKDQIIVGILIMLVTVIVTTYLPLVQAVVRHFFEPY